jgi:hypothetical protein
MKRLTTLLIILLTIIIFVVLGWFLFVRDPEIPLGEAISDALPFGSGDNLSPADILRDNSPDIVSTDNNFPDQFSTRVEKIRITNNTLPKIYEAYFRSDGTSVILRSLKDNSDTVENLSLTLTPPRAQATSSEFYGVSSTMLRGNIGSIAVGSGNLVAIPSFVGNRTLFSYLEGGEIRLVVKNGNNTIQTSIETFADKCTWSVRGAAVIYCATPIDWNPIGEPENWYAGVTHFSDRIWKFDIDEDIAQVISEPKSTLGIDIDVVDLKLSPDENYLVFINKRDLSLWALRLESF